MADQRLFGTNGIRGIPNEDLTVDFAMRVGKSIGMFVSGDVALGRDTRISGDMISSAVIAGLTSTGHNIVDLGILPTPALQYYCKNHGIYGVMITASHNPPQYNGIKVIDRDGTEIERPSEEKIEGIYHSGSFSSVKWEDAGRIRYVDDALDQYISGVLSKVDVNRIKERKFRVLVDTGNGAAYFSTPMLLERLGCTVVTLNANPDGRFTSRNAEPKPENLRDLMALMSTGNFDLGVAHDGDADRVVFIDEKGQFIDGDKSLALLVKNVASAGDIVVTPVSSSDIIADICSSVGATLIRTKVGAPIVARTMIQNGAVIGGEENGGVIYGKHQYCRDGAMTLSLMLDLMARSNKKISELVRELPQYFLDKRQVERTVDWSRLQKELQKGEKVDLTDGVKILKEDGWILIRPSGTEKILRIYAESIDMSTAKKYADQYVAKIRDLQEKLG
ncbi:phosphoglucosamine mutase [Thermoplasma sp. Kam2015]|uniref:phosphoglucosamine mutase n=1 Tax=Thermoplasma sp. Kam2015 TaxID=2094122 RepID=UPI001F0041CA|nr:phosphoglucosamine mutase [Thermoplasma sp. Kam2015]